MNDDSLAKKRDDDDFFSNLRECNIEIKSTTLLLEVTTTPSMDHNDKGTILTDRQPFLRVP